MTDGNLASTVMPAAIRECKNEQGDVLNKVILNYANFLSKALDHPRRFYNFSTRFPSILMVDIGTPAHLSSVHLFMYMEVRI